MRRRPSADDQQKQLKSLQGQKTDLQAQLTKSMASNADLSSQLEKSKQLVASLQANVDRANDSAARSQKQLDAANSHAADLQTMLDKAVNDAAKPGTAAVEVRPLPISSSFEKAFWGGKYTLHLKNQGSELLRINVAVDGGSVSAATVQAGTMFDVSNLKEGSSVVVSSDGFTSVVLTVKYRLRGVSRVRAPTRTWAIGKKVASIAHPVPAREIRRETIKVAVQIYQSALRP